MPKINYRRGIYTGDLDKNNKPSGKGKIVYSNGDYYEVNYKKN